MQPETSPHIRARIAGSLYLIVIIAGFFHYGIVRPAVIAPRDAATTAANILSREELYRTGFAAAVILLACNIPLALMFYELFKVVKRSLAMLVAFLILVATAIEAFGALLYFAPLVLLHGSYLPAAEQAPWLSYVSLDLQGIGFNFAAVFFALDDLVLAYLIVRSNFISSIPGLLMGLAGLCYLTNSFATFLLPNVAVHLIPYILVPSGIGELTFTLWLLIIGVNVARWTEMADAAQ